jgi:hypothetical protein
MRYLVVLNDYREVVKVFNEYGSEVSSDFAMFTEEGIYRVYKHFEELENGLYVIMRVRPKIPKTVYEVFYEVIIKESNYVELIDVGMHWINEISDENINEVKNYVLSKWRFKRKEQEQVV